MEPTANSAATSPSFFAASAATLGSASPAALRLELLPAAPGPDFAPRPRHEALERVVNFTIAFVALLVVSPAMLLTALAVKLTSPGPALYTQTRVGRDRRRGTDRASAERRRSNNGGSLFTIYKFRSMRTDAEASGQAVWATQNDPRVTPIGAFLRKSRLDELPQLFNVLKGDMNIVGPRPERPQIFVELAQHIPEYHLRALAKPGITGLAQINHSYDTCMDGVRIKVRYDLEWMRTAGLLADLMIMAKTIPVMVLRKGGW